jgi:ketose-bisphosphate aldolase
MSCENIKQMLDRAARGNYAIGYFESWNLESLQGVVDAAERSRSPIILGFNGDFLSRPDRLAEERLEIYAAIARAAADSAGVPCGLIFNECPHDEWIRRASKLGFNLVMPADPRAPFELYTRRVAKLVQYAHELGVSVEAEVGELPCGASGSVGDDGNATTPEIAEQFVNATGVDLLAVSVGNVHIRVEGEQGLDLSRLAEIRRRVSVPLVLHGGSGIEANALREAIKLGVGKVNYGTYLKQHYLAAIRAALAANERNPHELLGIGGPRDVMVAGRVAVRNAVLQRIGLLGCEGKA